MTLLVVLQDVLDVLEGLSDPTTKALFGVLLLGYLAVGWIIRNYITEKKELRSENAVIRAENAELVKSIIQLTQKSTEGLVGSAEVMRNMGSKVDSALGTFNRDTNAILEKIGSLTNK